MASVTHLAQLLKVFGVPVLVLVPVQQAVQHHRLHVKHGVHEGILLLGIVQVMTWIVLLESIDGTAATSRHCTFVPVRPRPRAAGACRAQSDVTVQCSRSSTTILLSFSTRNHGGMIWVSPMRLRPTSTLLTGAPAPAFLAKYRISP